MSKEPKDTMTKTNDGGYCKKLRRKVHYCKLRCIVAPKGCDGPCCKYWDVEAKK